jgi:hypothetical protein
MRTLTLVAALAAASPLLAQDAGGMFLVRESGRGFTTLQEAVTAIGAGRGTIVVPPGRHRQCAVQEAGEVTFTAERPGSAILDSKACEGKAALVLRGRSATVDGLIFQGISVPDANGAGIRMEKGRLVVRQSLFRDSENGILSAADPSGSILVEQSTFSGLGRCDPDVSCAHSIYIGEFGSLVVRRTRFERGTGGHYVKSRAPRIEVTDSSFDDVDGRATNYMIDLPAGAAGIVARNTFVQGRGKDNYSALIAVAGEGRVQSSAALVIRDNVASLAPGMDKATSFVADWSGEVTQIESNRLGPRIGKYERR